MIQVVACKRRALDDVMHACSPLMKIHSCRFEHEIILSRTVTSVTLPHYPHTVFVYEVRYPSRTLC